MENMEYTWKILKHYIKLQINPFSNILLNLNPVPGVAIQK